MQNPPGGFLSWLYTNAPAAWLSAIIATITCLVLIGRRTRPKRLVVREAGVSSLVRVWPGVRRKIKISFDDKPITTLGQIDYELFNQGSDVIQKPTFTFTFPTGLIILDTLLKPAATEAEIKIDANKVIVKLPFVNPFREHRQKLALSILVDGNPAKVEVTGAGEGWSIRRPISMLRRDVALERGLIFIGAGLMLAGFRYSGYVEAKYGIGRSEISWRAFVSTIPQLTAMLVWLVIFLRHTYNKSARRKDRWSRLLETPR